MPALSYPTSDFVPFTKILSSEVNGKFNAIKTLLNTTKLDSTNVQSGGLSLDRLAVQTSVQVVITNTVGVLAVTQFLPAVNGGLGFSFSPTTLSANLVVQANSTGSALTLDVVPSPVYDKIYALYRFS